MNVLITGARGFVGKNLVCARKNIRDGKDRSFGDIEIGEIFEYDIDSNLEDLENYSKNADFVFNLAGVNRPQTPEIFVGFRERFCSFAILMETCPKSVRHRAQQRALPQLPMPPTSFASSRIPICLSSMRVRKTDARSFTSSRKSTLPSDVK